MVHSPIDQFRITVANGFQAFVNRSENRLVKLSFMWVFHQNLRAHHRHQSQSAAGGNNHDDGDNPTQLTEHHTCNTFNHGQGQKHRQHGQGGSNNRKRDLLGSMNRSFFRLLTFIYMRRDILQDHNGIVHYHTDSDG